MRTLSILAVLTAVLVAGCSGTQGRVYDWSTAARETYTSHSHEVVMGASAQEAQQAAVVEGQANGYDQPIAGWWLTRNDQRLGVRSGYRSAQYQDYTTYTYDRQQSYGGHVYDTYYRNTYSTRYGQTVR